MRNLIIGVAVFIAIISAVFVGMRFSNVKDNYQSSDRRVAQPDGSNVELDTSKRVALVIGNRDYSIKPLANTINDAEDIASTLEGLGFKVIKGMNKTRNDLIGKIWEFRDALKDGAGVGLFYYSGHGMQVNGENYLIPIGARIEIEEDAETNAVGIQRVLNAMKAGGSGLNIVILDACRDNPYSKSFKSGGATGLAPITKAPKGTIIAYATDPGSVARDRNLDGSGRNGLYTGALLEQMKQPGLEIMDMFNKVGAVVENRSNDEQIPWINTSYRGHFYLAPGKEESVASGTKPQIATSPQKEEVASLPQPEIEVTHELRYGSLVITSPISGVEVWLGKKSLGKTQSGTEMLASKVPVGSYKLKASKKGYKPWEKEIEVEADRVHKLPIKLKPTKPPQQVASIPKPEHKPTVSNRDKAIALEKKGDKYYFQSEYNKAIVEYTKAIEIDPKDTYAYNNRGNSYNNLGKHTTAIADYTKAIEIDPEFVRAYINRGYSYGQLEKYTTAIADYTKAIEIDPKDTYAYNGRGYAYNLLGKYTTAIADFTKAIELDPEYAKAYYNRGHSYINLEKYTSAIADYTKAIEIDPKDTYAYNNRGYTYRKLGQHDKAEADYEMAKELGYK